MEKENREDKNPKGKKHRAILNQQFYWLIGIILFLVIFFIVMTAFLQSLKSLDYQGLPFTKVKYGNTYFYQYSYYAKDLQGNINKYYLNLQIDPRENIVPLEGKISFVGGQFVYLSVNETGLNTCQYGAVAVSSLAGFLAGNNIKAKAAVPNEEEASARGVEYANCEHSPLPDHIVILLEQGNETKIIKENNCHRIQITDCDLQSATEKFMVQAILDSRSSSDQNSTFG